MGKRTGEINQEDRVSKAWRADDHYDDEWLTIERLAKLAREGGPEYDEDKPASSGWFRRMASRFFK